MHALRRVGLAAALGLAAAACRGGDASNGEIRTTERDSTGIHIVENRVPDHDSRLPWTIGTGPEVSIGTVGGGDAYQLYRVTGAMRLPDGRILVANAGSYEIRVFDGNGVFLDAWGHQGEGPGEFSSIAFVGAWAGDSIYAWDGRLRRMTVFDNEGRFGRTAVLDQRDEIPAAQFVGRLSDGTIVAGSTNYYRAGEAESGPSRRDRAFGRFEPDGAFLNGLGSYPELELLVINRSNIMALAPLPYSHNLVTAVWGGRMVFSPNDDYEIRSYDLSGRLAQIVRLDRELIEVRQEDVDTWVAEQVARIEEGGPINYREVFESLQGGGTFPAFSALQVDALDHLWLNEYELPGDDRQLWTVFDPAGHALGTVETPPELSIYEIGEDYILGKSTDELDVEYVQ